MEDIKVIKKTNTKPYKITVLIMYCLIIAAAIIGAALLTRSIYFVNYWSNNGASTAEIIVPNDFSKPYLGLAYPTVILMWGVAIAYLVFLYRVIRMLTSKDEMKVKKDCRSIWLLCIAEIIVRSVAFLLSIGFNCVYEAELPAATQQRLWGAGVPISSYSIATVVLAAFSWTVAIPGVVFTANLKDNKE